MATLYTEAQPTKGWFEDRWAAFKQGTWKEPYSVEGSIKLFNLQAMERRAVLRHFATFDQVPVKCAPFQRHCKEAFSILEAAYAKPLYSQNICSQLILKRKKKA